MTTINLKTFYLIAICEPFLEPDWEKEKKLKIIYDIDDTIEILNIDILRNFFLTYNILIIAVMLILSVLLEIGTELLNDGFLGFAATKCRKGRH